MTTVAGDAEGAMYRQKLDKVFRPASVALVGVSGDPHRLNAAPLRILRKTGFNGRILLVNPKYDEIDGIPCRPMRCPAR